MELRESVWGVSVSMVRECSACSAGQGDRKVCVVGVCVAWWMWVVVVLGGWGVRLSWLDGCAGVAALPL